LFGLIPVALAVSAGFGAVLIANNGIKDLGQYVDSLIIVPNSKPDGSAGQ